MGHLLTDGSQMSDLQKKKKSGKFLADFSASFQIWEVQGSISQHSFAICLVF